MQLDTGILGLLCLGLGYLAGRCDGPLRRWWHWRPSRQARNVRRLRPFATLPPRLPRHRGRRTPRWS